MNFEDKIIGRDFNACTLSPIEQLENLRKIKEYYETFYKESQFEFKNQIYFVPVVIRLKKRLFEMMKEVIKIEFKIKGEKIVDKDFVDVIIEKLER